MVHTTDNSVSALKKMLLIRSFETAVATARDSGEIRGFPHLGNGHEAVAAGVTDHLDSYRDMVTGSHRSHGPALAMGMPAGDLMAEMFGRENAPGKGMGGEQHFFAPDCGFLSSNGIVGGQVPIAAGAALSAKARGEQGIAVAFMGDGAINQGGVMETMNLAVVLKLPLLFVVENNGLAQSTGSATMTAGGGAVSRAKAMSMPAVHIDGSDHDNVHREAGKLIDWVRTANMPALLEADVCRLGGHYHGDQEPYRKEPGHRDPIRVQINKLLAHGHTEEEMADLQSVADAAIELAVRHAREGKPTDEDTLAVIASETCS